MSRATVRAKKAAYVALLVEARLLNIPLAGHTPVEGRPPSHDEIVDLRRIVTANTGGRSPTGRIIDDDAKWPRLVGGRHSFPTFQMLP